MEENKPIQLDAAAAPAKEMQTTLRRIDRREWWLWSSALLVMLFLMVGIASFSFSDLFSDANSAY
jgi:hypothetical protein